MSFTSTVKQELLRIIPASRHCRMAELAGMVSVLGKKDNDDNHLELLSENELVIKKAEKLIKKIFSVDNIGNILYDRKRSGKVIVKCVFSLEQTEEMKKLLKMKETLKCDARLYTMTCCKRSFLRGAFLGTGTITDPNKDYHFEMPCSSEQLAETIRQLISDFDLEAKIIERKGRHVVYIKDGEMIGEVLNVMGAQNAMMELENVRILKGVRNYVNRQVNCDSANIRKALAASSKQLEDISYIREKTGFSGLGEDLVETALLREKYPEASLAELVMYNGETVGKSGINHRLKKLSEIADKLRNGD